MSDCWDPNSPNYWLLSNAKTSAERFVAREFAELSPSIASVADEIDYCGFMGGSSSPGLTYEETSGEPSSSVREVHFKDGSILQMKFRVVRQNLDCLVFKRTGEG